MYGYDDEKTTITTLKQFKDVLKKKTEKVIHDKFQWTTVEKWILGTLKAHVEDIVMGVLGFEWKDDRWGKGHGQWEFDEYDEGNAGSIKTIIARMVAPLVEQNFEKYFQAFRAKVEATLVSPKMQKELACHFKYEFDSALKQRICTWIEENVEAEAEAVFNRHGEEFMKSIRLKVPATMGSIELIAKAGVPLKKAEK